jgi:hypothetical protein
MTYHWKIDNLNNQVANRAFNILETKYHYDCMIIKEKRYDTYKIIINSETQTKDIINKFGKIFYDKNDKKYIPLEILNEDYKIRNIFFTGFCDAYKCKPTFDNSSFDINNKISAQCLYFLCKSLGYNVSLNTQKYNNNIYTLYISKNEVESLKNDIKQIIKLSDKEQYVYDLETENHHFQAGIGQMIVHNTDGSHIKGLLMNFIHTFWPGLMKIDGFFQSIATPIVKVFKKNDNSKTPLQTFYTINEYTKWCEKT